MINSLQAGSVGHVHQSPLAAPVAKRTDTQPSAEATSQFDRFLADVMARIDDKRPGVMHRSDDTRSPLESPDPRMPVLTGEVRGGLPVYPTATTPPAPGASSRTETR